jgi:hypothetical protein
MNRKKIVCSVFIFLLCVCATPSSSDTYPPAIDPAETQTFFPLEKTKEYFIVTQDLHSELEEYVNELIPVINTYVYQADPLLIDDLIAKVMALLKGYISDTKHEIWTINRLLYLEHFHQQWEQNNLKATDVILKYIDATITKIEKDSSELKSLPHKVPSMTEVPLLVTHLQKTNALVQKALAILERMHADFPTKNTSDDV